LGDDFFVGQFVELGVAGDGDLGLVALAVFDGEGVDGLHGGGGMVTGL